MTVITVLLKRFKEDKVSQGRDIQDSWIKEQKDIRDGLSLRREFNLAKRIAKEAEGTGKNIINERMAWTKTT